MTTIWDPESVAGLLRSLGLDAVEAMSDDLLADFEQRALASAVFDSALAREVSPCNVFDASWE
ncbi:MAG: hypothetical protein P8M16_09665 [Acidimicrobiales bacterium]|nr:hypothetical protein [Acidimicrobiales bacterium]